MPYFSASSARAWSLHGFFFFASFSSSVFSAFSLSSAFAAGRPPASTSRFSPSTTSEAFLHFVVGEGNEQVSDAEDGVACVFAHVHARSAAVFFSR